jgi:aminoglycoside phosphotransferase (APT) family kinase protein
MVPELYPMFVHGDLWSTNMLWNGDQLASIIDWQICRCGTLVEDLQRVLATCVSADVRRRMTDTLLYYYYGQLCKSMALTNRVMPFDWTQLCVAYKWTLAFTAADTVFTAGMWISSPVLLRGDNPSARIDEMLQRTKAIVDDALDAFDDDHKYCISSN